MPAFRDGNESTIALVRIKKFKVLKTEIPLNGP